MLSLNIPYCITLRSKQGLHAKQQTLQCFLFKHSEFVCLPHMVRVRQFTSLRRLGYAEKEWEKASASHERTQVTSVTQQRKYFRPLGEKRTKPIFRSCSWLKSQQGNNQLYRGKCISTTRTPLELKNSNIAQMTNNFWKAWRVCWVICISFLKAENTILNYLQL